MESSYDKYKQYLSDKRRAEADILAWAKEEYPVGCVVEWVEAGLFPEDKPKRRGTISDVIIDDGVVYLYFRLCPDSERIFLHEGIKVLGKE